MQQGINLKKCKDKPTRNRGINEDKIKGKNGCGVNCLWEIIGTKSYRK